MRVSKDLQVMWLMKLRELRLNGYDPYNSLGDLRLGKGGISFSWRPQ